MSKIHAAAVLPSPGADLQVETRSTPSPGLGELLIRNYAIGLNPIDQKRQAWGLFITSYPVILGADISGMVAQVGPEVSNFKIGDRVFAFSHQCVSGNNDNGAYQEYTIVKATAASHIPDTMSYQQAATLPTAVSTSVMALADNLSIPRPKNGEVNATPRAILIWGAGSSVGNVAVPLARLFGLTVFATASERHHERILSLGASAVIDYHSPTVIADVVSAVRKAGAELDIAFDTISTHDTLALTAELLEQLSSPSGAAKGETKLIHTLPWPEEQLSQPKGFGARQVGAEQMWTRREDLLAWAYHEVVPEWIEQGKIVPHKYRMLPGGLKGLQHGLEVLRQQAVSGEKLVIELLALLVKHARGQEIR